MEAEIIAEKRCIVVEVSALSYLTDSKQTYTIFNECF
jgi:hypothetical protein